LISNLYYIRVWRYRGGRDGHETLQQFMNFLGKPAARVQTEEATPISPPISDVYPGTVAFCVPELAVGQSQERDYSSLQVRGTASGGHYPLLGEANGGLCCWGDDETTGEGRGGRGYRHKMAANSHQPML